MQPDSLLKTLKTPISKTKVEELAKILSESGYSVQALIELTFDKEEQIGFRASWILENIFMHHQEVFIPHTAYFLSVFSSQNNLSCRRHFGKILALITSKKAQPELKKVLAVYDTLQLVEIVFSWLIDDGVPVAVKSHCLNILANLSLKHDWIKDELVETMNFLMDKESIAFYAKAKQIRKQLIATIKQ